MNVFICPINNGQTKTHTNDSLCGVPQRAEFNRLPTGASGTFVTNYVETWRVVERRSGPGCCGARGNNPDTTTAVHGVRQPPHQFCHRLLMSGSVRCPFLHRMNRGAESHPGSYKIDSPPSHYGSFLEAIARKACSYRALIISRRFCVITSRLVHVHRKCSMIIAAPGVLSTTVVCVELKADSSIALEPPESYFMQQY